MSLLDQALFGPSTGYATGGVVGQPPAGLQAPQGSGQLPPSMGAMQQSQPGQPGMQGGTSQAMNPQLFDMHTNDMLQRNPQVSQQITQAINQAIQSGQINPQQLQMAFQLAQACLQNPALWPQLRQAAIRMGLAGPNDLPQQYDQGLVMAVLTAARAYTQGNHAGSYAEGGMVQGTGTGTSDSIPATNVSDGSQVKVSNGEMIIPANVVAAKGKDFFDGLIRKYADVSQHHR